ncbi:MAG: phosphatidylglycerophosphatase A [Desulfobacterales bacterium]|nr:phosphatidylglycerophosphatase A [Desulfobacterales bacterium]MDD4071521.1 phosphatidylglycerophosphatase A [Desulfobacterales bacterium]MDD4391807.1 phosphatidylglycerophosphatase A [Desulfobacterales bacterium]
MNYKDKWVVFFATGGYIGKIPFAPGTFGTLPGVLICYVMSCMGIPAAVGIAVLLTIVSIWISERAEFLLNQKDPGCIVIDEIAGMAITLLGLPFNALTVVAGFVLFRLFDILKPWPVGYLDRNLSGGTGIVLDDVAAGILANIVIRLFYGVF